MTKNTSRSIRVACLALGITTLAYLGYKPILENYSVQENTKKGTSVREKSAELDQRYDALFAILNEEASKSREELDAILKVSEVDTSGENSLPVSRRVSADDMQEAMREYRSLEEAMREYRSLVRKHEDSLLALQVAREKYNNDKVQLYTSSSILLE